MNDERVDERNEERKLVANIRATLDGGLGLLSASTVARLAGARREALSRQRERVVVRGLSLAGVGGAVGEWVSGPLPVLGRNLLAALALALGVCGTYYWNQFEQAANNEAIDSALLSDELPPAAYIDKGFQAWLATSAQPSQ